ncbi:MULTISPECIES: PPE family protein [Mycolicibacterium]|jgi:PPE-repeat protein|uniref:PPE protein n=4 Tax=Mycolicibacterium TaxID=1866885 RepID=A1T178_MYCVP|nr:MULTISPECIES: PPE family protein [Mycolicibacterium]ABM10928.1 PPE protein [Mycolicibacterium vanbaalenii PYR-1]MDN4516432.1 PPE family protein [Mycolicibacterium austroafricanum]MDW5610052.1 PPE family protein [Mycolicibacterium sp. D5.8-2]QRZ07087.1 PPE family protein [Mycolicibacterium austroafricanum]QZT55696.1 PPE family protein [Mycolicibacterium austroafricanum]
MATIGIPIPPIWGAFPPEINTSRLQAGAGAVPMLQAAAGWEAFAISLETQADELAASLATLSQMWQGTASERAVMATMPMVMWLRMLSLQAQKRAAQASAQATAWASAATSTPQLPEIETNHITNAVLNATNFLGVNTVPIAVNEADYIRMWNQAAAVMTGYETETILNSTFEPVAPPKPITVFGSTQAAMATAIGSAAPGIASAAARNATFTKVSVVGKLDEVNQKAGHAEGLLQQAADSGRSQAEQGQLLQQAPQQGMQMGMQMASQLGSTLGQLPQQMMQGVTQPFQQLTQPLQQMSSLFGQMGGLGGDRGAQIGMLGATPFSNHPAIGGSGAATGAGLVRAASLPGAGGTAARTPLMSNLVGSGLQPTVSAVAVGAGAGAGAGAGLAPVGAGSGMGGGGPMGMLGQRGKSGGNKPGLNAPAPLEHDLSEDDDDDW